MKVVPGRRFTALLMAVIFSLFTSQSQAATATGNSQGALVRIPSLNLDLPLIPSTTTENAEGFLSAQNQLLTLPAELSGILNADIITTSSESSLTNGLGRVIQTNRTD